MTFNINEIKSQLQFGGARPNLFQVTFSNPANNAGFLKVPVMVTSASIPASGIQEINVPFMGRNIKVAGDRTDFPAWQVDVMNDEDFLIRNGLEEWHNRINGLETNVRTMTNYKSEAQVIQYAKDGSILRTYHFHGIWPGPIGEIRLSWQDNNTIETFPVAFNYDWWTVSGKTGDAGGR
jgi:hypothetical protein